MRYRVEVSTTPTSPMRGARAWPAGRGLGIAGIEAHRGERPLLPGRRPGRSHGRRLCDALLYDPVVEQAAPFSWISETKLTAGRRGREGAHETLRPPRLCGENAYAIEVVLRPGVTDSVAESLLAGARLIGVTGLARAATGQRYVIAGHINPPSSRRLAEGLLANVVIQTYAVDAPAPPPFVPTQAADDDGRDHPADRRR